MDIQQKKAWQRLFAIQSHVVQAFPEGAAPVKLVSSNGRVCPTQFLHKKDGFFVDLSDSEKHNWQNVHVLPWLVNNPGAALVQDGISVVV